MITFSRYPMHPHGLPDLPAWTVDHHAHFCRAAETIADLESRLWWAGAYAGWSFVSFLVIWFTAWYLHQRASRLRDQLVDAGDEIDGLLKANDALRDEVRTYKRAIEIKSDVVGELEKERDDARQERDHLQARNDNQAKTIVRCTARGDAVKATLHQGLDEFQQKMERLLDGQSEDANDNFRADKATVFV